VSVGNVQIFVEVLVCLAHIVVEARACLVQIVIEALVVRVQIVVFEVLACCHRVCLFVHL
jgi:hypothetical protein